MFNSFSHVALLFPQAVPLMLMSSDNELQLDHFSFLESLEIVIIAEGKSN